MTRLLIAHWLDPFSPNFDELSEGILHLSRSRPSTAQLESPRQILETQISNILPISSQTFTKKRPRFDETIHPNGNGNLINGRNSLLNGSQKDLTPTMTSFDLASTAHARNLSKLLISPQALAQIDRLYLDSIQLPLPLGDLECPLCLRIYWEPDVTPCG